MNWKNRLTSYNFWVSIVSAVILILQAFHFEFDIVYINEIVTAVLGLLVVIGIVNDPTKSSKTNTNKNTTSSKTEDIQTSTGKVTNEVNKNINITNEEENISKNLKENEISNIINNIIRENAELNTNEAETKQPNTQKEDKSEQTEQNMPINPQNENADCNSKDDFSPNLKENKLPIEEETPQELEQEMLPNLEETLNYNPSEEDFNISEDATQIKIEENLETDKLNAENAQISEDLPQNSENIKINEEITQEQTQPSYKIVN